MLSRPIQKKPRKSCKVVGMHVIKYIKVVPRNTVYIQNTVAPILIMNRLLEKYINNSLIESQQHTPFRVIEEQSFTPRNEKASRLLQFLRGFGCIYLEYSTLSISSDICMQEV